MMPFPGLNDVRVQWLAIQRGNYKIYGFLIYTGSDYAIVEFLKEGIIDLDVLSGEECAIFLIEPPSKRWIDYVNKHNHPWKQYLDQLIVLQSTTLATEDDNDAEERGSVPDNVQMRNIFNSVVIVGNGNEVNVEQLMTPNYEALFDRSEAYEVADHFRIPRSQLPCLVFFKSLDDRNVWPLSLRIYRQPWELTDFFRDFFESPAFKALLA
ncbi:hypothetical protein [Mucilaginibacter sp. OK283]|uniref:hypothetical protein n=1 Tax=Mucilaginibacter sp. OK283 TaxID=1881049 RepID=UPI0008B0D15B|nr:hypothetical protein [Mucilaginibacter sp. OK283]SEP06070.1 hypothetical protein SAMN05428947_106178 [Mucilaginibacter sp. OK283]